MSNEQQGPVDRDETQVPEAPPPESPGFEGSGGLVGSRPAENARQASLEEALNEEWSGGDGAMDFLDLEGELAGELVPEAGIERPPEAEEEPAPEVDPGDYEALEAEEGDEEGSWLLGLDPDEADRAGEDCIVPGLEPEPIGPATLDASWTEESGARGLVRRWAVRTAAAAALVMICVAGWQLLGVGSRMSDGENPEALAPNRNLDHRLLSPDSPAGGGSTRGSGRQPVGRAPSAPGGSVAASGAAPGPAAPSPDQPAPGQPVPLLEGPAVAGATPGPAAPGEGTSDAGAGDPGAPALGTPSAEARSKWRKLLGLEGGISLPRIPTGLGLPIPGAGPTAPAFARGTHPELDAGPLPRADAADLAQLWTGFDIPRHRIDDDQRLLTPGVGWVRLRLNNGAILEGRLHAVGLGRVWLDARGGRLGLRAAEVGEMVHVMSGDGSAVPGNLAVIDLEPVRVRTAGGVIEGWVVTREGSATTVVTEGGTRITFASDQVEILSQAPEVVLRVPPELEPPSKTP